MGLLCCADLLFVVAVFCCPETFHFPCVAQLVSRIRVLSMLVTCTTPSAQLPSSSAQTSETSCLMRAHDSSASCQPSRACQSSRASPSVIARPTNLLPQPLKTSSLIFRRAFEVRSKFVASLGKCLISRSALPAMPIYCISRVGPVTRM